MASPALHKSDLNLRFSGHESFVLRYAWLPKAAAAVVDEPAILTTGREDDAMVQLGVGKNMVRSIRFWAEATDIIHASINGHRITKFGRELLIGDGRTLPLDPYLEDLQTLWLLHWKLSTNRPFLIFAWDFLMNQFQEPELSATTALRAFQKAMPQASAKGISVGSLAQLFDIFLRSYVPSRSKKGEVREDNLDCPLVELDLLRHTGFGKSSLQSSRPEPKFAFRREDKQEIGNELFGYCLSDFWNNRFSSADCRELSVPLHVVANGHGSPGQIFKLPEAAIRARLLEIEELTEGRFRFEESAAVPRVIRHSANPPKLRNVFKQIAYA